MMQLQKQQAKHIKLFYETELSYTRDERGLRFFFLKKYRICYQDSSITRAME